MAGIRGKSGPPGNQNAFRHGLAGIAQRRVNGALTAAEQSIREEILNGLINDKGGKHISTAMRVLAGVIASDAAWLIAVNRAIDGVMESNQKARSNPEALHTLDGYKRGLVNSLTVNPQAFVVERAARSRLSNRSSTSGRNATPYRATGLVRLARSL